jgi:hypothetical protein
MKNPLKAILGKKPKSAGEIEVELAKLSGKLAEHQRRRSELLQAAEEARATWRESLAEDDDVIAAAKARVDKLEREADDAGRVIAEYEAAISAAEERLRTASADERRRAAAAALEAVAKKVDALKAELERDVAKMASTARKLMAAIPADMGVFPVVADTRPGVRPEKGNAFASNREAVSAVCSEALVSEIPELYDFIKVGHYHALGLLAVGDPQAARIEAMGWSKRDALGLPAGAAIDALISSRLRDRAARILAGEVEPDGSAIKIEKPFRHPDPPAETRIVGLRNFKFLSGEPGWKPHTKIIAKGSADYVPDQVASAAFSRGWAAPFESREGQAAIEQLHGLRSQRIGSLTPEECADLGDPLGLRRAYEAANTADAARNNQVEAEEAERALG